MTQIQDKEVSGGKVRISETGKEGEVKIRVYKFTVASLK
jgi:hypothetical protein